MPTLLTAKIDMGLYGVSDRMVCGVVDNPDDLELLVAAARDKWKQHKVIFEVDTVELNRFLIK